MDEIIEEVTRNIKEKLGVSDWGGLAITPWVVKIIVEEFLKVYDDGNK